jgi:hypothetical protein
MLAVWPGADSGSSNATFTGTAADWGGFLLWFLWFGLLRLRFVVLEQVPHVHAACRTGLQQQRHRNQCECAQAITDQVA